MRMLFVSTSLAVFLRLKVPIANDYWDAHRINGWEIRCVMCRFHDGTPFAFQEHRKAVDFFGAFHSSVSSRSHFPGSQLCAAGYEYFGSEPVSIAAWRSRSIGIYNLDRFTRDYLVY